MKAWLLHDMLGLCWSLAEWMRAFKQDSLNGLVPRAEKISVDLAVMCRGNLFRFFFGSYTAKSGYDTPSIDR